MAQLRDPSDPLPDALPFSLPSSAPLNKSPTSPLTEPTIAPSMNLLRTSTTPPPQIVSAVEFMRHSRSPHAQLFICVFRSLEQLNAHIDSNDKDTAQFADHIKHEALTQFPTLFPSEHKNFLHLIAYVILSISLLTTKFPLANFIVNLKMNSMKQNAKSTNTSMLDTFAPQAALLVHLSFL